jgi:serine/threonine protein kinase
MKMYVHRIFIAPSIVYYLNLISKTEVMHRSLLISDVTVGPDLDTTMGDSGSVIRGQHKGLPVTLWQLTYQVRHEDVDVSALNADSSSNNPDTKNYYRDVLAWRSLCHHYILPPLGIFEVKSRSFLVFPLMTNGTLTKWRKKQPVPDVADMHNLVRIQYFRERCNGVYNIR